MSETSQGGGFYDEAEVAKIRLDGSSRLLSYAAVVDDDENICRSFGRLLRAAGLQAVTYDSAESFLADRKHPQFGCLVLDIQLGGMSGIELAEHLAATGQRTPIIFITAHDNPEAKSVAEALGCAGYFRKTDPGKEVLEAIRRVVLWHADGS